MIPARRVFNGYAAEYDRWFDENTEVYEAQIRMLKCTILPTGPCLEIGVGSGRFAAPLGIGYGIDPSRRLLAMAKDRGIGVVEGEGEHLPFQERTFRTVLMMTVLCFLEDPPRVFREAGRVLAEGGRVVAGFIERDGEIAEMYRNEQTKGRFLRFAQFQTTDEVRGYFDDAGFSGTIIAGRARGFCVMTGLKP